MIKAATNQQVPNNVVMPAAMKVLMLTWEFPPNVVGGLSRHVFGLSKQLAKMGVEVHVLTAGTGELPPFEIINGVHVYRVKPLNEKDDDFLSWIAGLNLALAVKAVQLAAELRFSIIHAHDWLVGAAAITLKDSLDLPLLTTIHATEYGRNGGIHNEMQCFIHQKEQQLIENSEQIVVCSEYMFREVLSVFGTEFNKIVVIPNGIEPEMEAAQRESLFPKPKDKTLIFSVGRIVREKGFETIIEAAALAKQNDLNLFFIVAGKGPLLENYRHLTREKELEAYLAFIGYISDEEKQSWLLESDIVVFPSLYEPFGIVALESLNYAKPTIVSDIGGLKGIIKHLKTGLLMKPGDVESLLTQIHFLVKNPQTAKMLGLQGRKMVKKLYGWNRVAVETKRVMEDTILTRRIQRDGGTLEFIQD